jgi:small subunit ribosomal protein S7
LRFEKEKVVNIFSIMENAILNVSPFLEVRKVRVSGKTRQIPSMIQKNRQQTLAIRWLIEAAKNNKKKNKTFADCLATEFLEAADKRGGARQKRNELHKVAHSNRTFLRYRWW